MTYVIAADWLKISINLLLVIHVIVCLLLALVVLMQRPKQEGLGAAFGGGLTNDAFGAQTTNVLQKGTVYLGTLFFVITLVLAILIGKQNKTDESLTKSDEVKEEAPSILDNMPEDIQDAAKDLLGPDTSGEGTDGEETEDIPEVEDTDEKPAEGEGAENGAGDAKEGAVVGAIIGAAVGEDAVKKAEEAKKETEKENPSE